MGDRNKREVVSTGPTQKIRRDLLKSERWPIGAVVAWRYAQIAGLSDADRDALVCGMAEHGVRAPALDVTRPDWYDLLRQALDEIVEAAALGNGFALLDDHGEPLRFGAAAALHGYDSSFALYRDQARDYFDRVEGLWCRASEVKATFKLELRASAKGEAGCKRWLEDAMRVSPTQPAASRDEWAKKARSEGFVISGRGFNRAWAEAVKATGSQWSKAGRRPRPSGKGNT